MPSAFRRFHALLTAWASRPVASLRCPHLRHVAAPTGTSVLVQAHVPGVLAPHGRRAEVHPVHPEAPERGVEVLEAMPEVPRSAVAVPVAGQAAARRLDATEIVLGVLVLAVTVSVVVEVRRGAAHLVPAGLGGRVVDAQPHAANGTALDEIPPTVFLTSSALNVHPVPLLRRVRLRFVPAEEVVSASIESKASQSMRLNAGLMRDRSAKRQLLP